MPDETVTTEPAAFTFPFDVPPDLTAASDGDLQTLHDQIREHAVAVSGLSPADTTDATVAALRAYAALAKQVTAENVARRTRAAEAGDLAAELSGELDQFSSPDPDDGDDGDGTLAEAEVVDLTDEDDEDEDTEDDDESADDNKKVKVAVTAATRRTSPRVRDVARGSRTPRLPEDTRTGVYGSLVASAGVAGFHTGQTLDRFADAAKLLSTRLDQYPQSPLSRTATYPKNKRPITVYDPEGRRLELHSYDRHPGVEIRRDYPTELRVSDNGGDGHGYAVAQYAATERRLPGGSLIESAKQAAKKGRSLTAAAGWCAPSETIYDLCEMETMDGILDAPELQTSRGGWQIPEDGGPDFTSIWNGIGNAGDVHLTEAEVIADTPKVCAEIPCPDFTEVRLGVSYVCLTGSLLQRRGYPEVVARWGRAAVIALAHKMNQAFIASIVAGSGAATVIGADPSGDDAASGLLGAVALAIEDIKYRNRMGFNSTVEIVLPHWTLVQIRAGLSRRTGVAMLDVTDAQIMAWFSQRGAVLRLVYDWQDAFSGLATGPGGATPLAALPVTVQFLAYPAGTWVKAVQDVISLDTIYDSSLLATNQYTAVFTETGWAALKMCNTSRLYTARVDPSGVVGCCPGEELS